MELYIVWSVCVCAPRRKFCTLGCSNGRPDIKMRVGHTCFGTPDRGGCTRVSTGRTENYSALTCIAKWLRSAEMDTLRLYISRTAVDFSGVVVSQTIEQHRKEQLEIKGI